jgi:PKD repeat protein
MVNNLNKGILILLFLTIAIVTVVGATVASFTATPSSGSAPLTVQFTDTTTGNPARWQWDFGDNNWQSSDDQIPTPVCKFSNTITAVPTTGTPLPFPVVSFTMSPSSGTLPLTVILTDTTPLAAKDRMWSPFSLYQAPSTYSKTITVSDYCKYYKSGVIPIKLQVWDNSQIYDNSYGESPIQNLILIVPPDPVSSFKATPNSGSPPLTVQFTDTSSNNPTIWKWSFGDGTSSTEQNPSHTYTTSGVYGITLESSTSTTCTAHQASTMIPVQFPTTRTTTNPTPTPAFGSISVSSTPSGANIYLDNEYKGLTPLTLNSVTNGNHVVLIKQTGYQDWSQNVVVLANLQSLSAALTATTTIASTPVTTPIPTATTTTRITTEPTTGQTTGITTAPTTSQTTVTIVIPTPTATVNYSATIAAMQSQIAEQGVKIEQQGNILDQITNFLRNVFGWK